MYKSLFFLTSILFSISISAQLDKERFQEIFDDETKEEKYISRDNHSTEYSHTKAQELPNWFFHPPTPGNGEFIGLGISDPGLDSTDAINMAINRAQIMAYMLKKSTTQFMVDYFINEVTDAHEVVYEHFARVITKMPASVNNCELIESYTNEFDETFALVKFIPDNSKSTMNHNMVFMELFKNEMQAGARGQYESVYELLVKDNREKDEVPLMYRVIEYGTRNDVEGTINNENYSLPIYSLRYTYILPDTVINKQFSHGIWKEVFKATITQILNKARKKPETIKDMGDNYQVESSEKLTRGISSNQMSFIWVGMGLQYDQLMIRLKEIPVE